MNSVKLKNNEEWSLNNAYCGDNLEFLRLLPDNSVDSVVTDPPYGLSFMGKKWDYDVPSVETWKECLRVLKPGGHLLSFAGTRTQHRMAVNIEDAGFEIRDMIAWVYGSGFPKSHNISKAIDKMAGAEREVIGQDPTILQKQAKDIREGKRKIVESFDAGGEGRNNGFKTVSADITSPTTDEAKQWDGWGTAIKPALEPITVARKPLSEKTVAKNVLKYGTGGINIDGCRVEGEIPKPRNAPKTIIRGGKFHSGAEAEKEMSHYNPTQGRFPANLIHDGSEEVEELFPHTKSGKDAVRKSPNAKGYHGNWEVGQEMVTYGDKTSASRFFYCAKASKKDRGEGNTHPTVKPMDLMKYLVRLVTPEGGICLDPYLGSFTTAIACKEDGFNWLGCELPEEEHGHFSIGEERYNRRVN